MQSLKNRADTLTLAAIAIILVYQLMIPPLVGLADQGDYARLAGKFHLGPVEQKPEDRFYGYLNRIYKPDDTFRIPAWESFSTQYIFAGSAVLLNKWISKDGLFDIRMLAFVEILAFLAACSLLLRATRPLVPGRLHLLIAAALILVFCDAGYICYFNSFYYEPASYIFLLAAVAVWLDIIAHRRHEPKYIARLGLFMVLFVAAKPQNVAVGLIAGVYLWRFRGLIHPPRWVASAVPVLVLTVSLAVYLTRPEMIRISPVYDMLFWDILPRSSDPAGELKSLGLDPAYAKYSGTAAFSPNTAFWDPAFRNQLDRHVNHFTIAGYYLRHPGKLRDYLRGVLPRSTSLRAEVTGNFEKSAGYPRGFRSEAFSIWSRFHDQFLARWPAGLLIGLALSILVSIWIAVSSLALQRRLLAECYAVLALSALVVFFSTVLADSLDVVKHLHLFNILTDICLLFAAFCAISFITSSRAATFRSARTRTAAPPQAQSRFG